MCKTKTGLGCLLLSVLCIATVHAEQVIKAVPQNVDVGTINLFQIKEAAVTLENTSGDTFHVDKVQADCSCVKTRLDTVEIGPGQKAELRLAVMLRAEGAFSHSVLVFPRNKEKHKPIGIRVTGTAREVVCAEIGWMGKQPGAMNAENSTDLGIAHYSSARLVVYVIAKDRKCDLSRLVPRVDSGRFEMADYKFETVPIIGPGKAAGREKRGRMTIQLKPQRDLEVGVIKDYVGIRLSDEIGVYTPIMFRIVGDVYADKQIIHLGALAGSEPKGLTLHFADGAKVWKDVKWSVEGYLSEAIVVMQRQDTPTELKISVDQSRLSRLPKGYVFCRMRLYQNGHPDENVVSVLIDGFED